MRIALLAVGKLGRATEAELARDYIQRAAAAGRGFGITGVELIEVEARKPGKAAEAEVLLGQLAPGDHLIACDEHGTARASRAFADHLGRLRDQGARRVVFAVGGADGLGEAVRERADETLAFGPQTWPHALVRAMLAEQVYRAVTIWAGSPYHRD